MSEYWNKERIITIGITMPLVFIMIFGMFVFFAFLNNDLSVDVATIAAQLSALVTVFAACAVGISAWVGGADQPVNTNEG